MQPLPVLLHYCRLLQWIYEQNVNSINPGMDLHCFETSIIWTQLDKAYKTTGHNAQGGFSYTIKRVLTPGSRLSSTLLPCHQKVGVHFFEKEGIIQVKNNRDSRTFSNT